MRINALRAMCAGTKPVVNQAVKFRCSVKASDLPKPRFMGGYTTDAGCQGGDLDRIATEYYYGPQVAGVANNLLLRGKSITAEGPVGQPETRVWCYTYDRLGNKTSETLPKGNSNLQSCP